MANQLLLGLKQISIFLCVGNHWSNLENKMFEKARHFNPFLIHFC